MCGSRPLPEAVTRSTGMEPLIPSARNRFTRAASASRSAGFVGPRFDPDDAEALYGTGAVADGRPRNQRAPSKDCPLSFDPRTTPFTAMALPFAWLGNTPCATPVTTKG